MRQFIVRDVWLFSLRNERSLTQEKGISATAAKLPIDTSEAPPIDVHELS
jgi:hypothetical protein